MARLAELVNEARKAGRKIHFLPPYRHDTQIALMDLLAFTPANNARLLRSN